MLSLAILPSIVLLFYIYKKDKRDKEPMKLLMGCFAVGVFSVIPSVLMETITEEIISVFCVEGSFFYAVLDGFVVAALAEETFKYLLLKEKTWKSTEFNCNFDGIIYAVFVSLGFATCENIFYVMDGGIGVAILRFFTAVPSHACDAVFMGYYYSKAKQASLLGDTVGEEKYKRKSLVIPLLLHGLYDCLISFEEDVAGENVMVAGVLIWIVFVIVMFSIAFNTINKASKNDSYFAVNMDYANSNPLFKLKRGNWICSCWNINNGNYCAKCGNRRPL